MPKVMNNTNGGIVKRNPTGRMAISEMYFSQMTNKASTMLKNMLPASWQPRMKMAI
jgi:hypothetical protein